MKRFKSRALFAKNGLISSRKVLADQPAKSSAAKTENGMMEMVVGTESERSVQQRPARLKDSS